VGRDVVKVAEERIQRSLVVGPYDKVSSTNRNQHLGLIWKFFKAKALKCSIKMLATTRDKEDPMVVPSIIVVIYLSFMQVL
jgi:hypothetical protein